MRSSCVGGVKPFGCFVDAALVARRGTNCARGLQTRRAALRAIRELNVEDMYEIRDGSRENPCELEHKLEGETQYD